MTLENKPGLETLINSNQMDTITCPTTKTDLYWRAENIETLSL